MNLPRTSRGYVAILVLIDHFSKWIATVPLRNKSAQATAAALGHQILPFLSDVPLRLLTDNGPEFWSECFKQTLQGFGIADLCTSLHTPFSNGWCELVNCILIQLLQILCPDFSNWDQYLGRVVSGYKHTYHSQICTTSVTKVGKIRPHGPPPSQSCYLNERGALISRPIALGKRSPFEIYSKVIWPEISFRINLRGRSSLLRFVPMLLRKNLLPSMDL